MELPPPASDLTLALDGMEVKGSRLTCPSSQAAAEPREPHANRRRSRWAARLIPVARESLDQSFFAAAFAARLLSRTRASESASTMSATDRNDPSSP